MCVHAYGGDTREFPVPIAHSGGDEWGCGGCSLHVHTHVGVRVHVCVLYEFDHSQTTFSVAPNRLGHTRIVCSAAYHRADAVVVCVIPIYSG